MGLRRSERIRVALQEMGVLRTRMALEDYQETKVGAGEQEATRDGAEAADETPGSPPPFCHE